ncbi:MAG: hypothetical protein JNM57_16545 [Cyclobacteriaceae bacterium]|nr:hypothetical protein [Cyclobacteriaceae bacterium]
MEEFELTFTCKARYFKFGEINSNTRQIWFVLHGYGQLARYFIRKFALLQEHNICIIAPEGLSRFYLEDIASRAQTGNNRVGATWMTKENRLMEIENYIQYLSDVYRKEIQLSTIPVTLLGFSQGAATASRWVVSKTSNFQRIILWAGVFPPDMDITAGSEIWKNKEVVFVYGKNDPFMTEEHLHEMKILSHKLGIHPAIIAFNGAHELDASTLLKLI